VVLVAVVVVTREWSRTDREAASGPETP
jgi:hypothetical protein